MTEFQNKKKYWRIKNGDYIKIIEMDNLHLAKVADMLISNAHRNWVKALMGQMKHHGMATLEYDDFISPKFKEIETEMERRIKLKRMEHD